MHRPAPLARFIALTCQDLLSSSCRRHHSSSLSITVKWRCAQQGGNGSQASIPEGSRPGGLIKGFSSCVITAGGGGRRSGQQLQGRPDYLAGLKRLARPGWSSWLSDAAISAADTLDCDCLVNYAASLHRRWISGSDLYLYDLPTL